MIILILTIILAIQLIYFNWKSNKNTLFLVAFLIILSFYKLIHCLLAIENFVFCSTVLFNLILPLTLLPGPLLFWYNQKTIQEKHKWNKLDYLHFIPVILQLIDNSLPKIIVLKTSPFFLKSKNIEIYY